MNETYALVNDDETITFPLTIEDINNIDVPTNEYFLCIYDDVPDINEMIESIVLVPKIIPSLYCRVCSHVVKKTIDELFAYLTELNLPTPTYFNMVPLDLYKGISTAISKEVSFKLDEFARSRRYDDINSAISYSGSDVLRYATEGQRAKALRDETWNILTLHEIEIQTLQAPVPTSWSQVEAVLPVLTWE
jgi:hypothetical protein